MCRKYYVEEVDRKLPALWEWEDDPNLTRAEVDLDLVKEMCQRDPGWWARAVEKYGYDKVEEALRVMKHCPICAALELFKPYYRGLSAIAISAEMKDEEVKMILPPTIYRAGYTVYISGSRVVCVRGVDCPGPTVVFYVTGYTSRDKAKWIRGDIVLEKHIEPD